MSSVKEIVSIFILVFSLIGTIDALVLVARLSQLYEPNVEGAINYLSEIMVYLVRDAVISALVSLPLGIFYKFLKEL